ncbi:MAG: adaptor protein MecA [Clostridia bacterium]|nr:adaptor protein MecA [Clostridia bacterium]
MKIEKIRYNKLKVTVSVEDMLMWGVSADAVVRNAPAAQNLFWEMLRIAENETGFAVDNSRLLVEAIPGDNDDVVLFVTRVDSAPEMPKQQSRKLRVKNSRKLTLPTSVCLRFNNFEDLIALSHNHPDFCGGTLYSLQNAYFLVVPDKSSALYSEYCSEIASMLSLLLVEEHGHTIFSDRALEQIRENFHM